MFRAVFNRRHCRFFYYVILVAHFTVLRLVVRPLNRTEASRPKPRFQAEARLHLTDL